MPCFRLVHWLSQGRLLAVVVTLLSLVPFSVNAGELPQILYSSNPDREYPVWVGADAAVDPQGRIYEDLFFPGAINTLGGYFAHSSEGSCISVSEIYEAWVDPPDRTSLAKAIRHSELVLLARVTNKAFGFKQFMPGQLLEVEPVRTLRGVAVLDRYYTYLPVGTFSAGPYTICKTDGRYPKVPEINDEVLLIVPRVHDASDPFLVLQEAFSIVVLPASGGVSVATHWSDDRSSIGSKELLLSETERITIEDVTP